MALQDILQKITNETDKKAAFMQQVVMKEIQKIQEEAQARANSRKMEIEEKIKVKSISIIQKSKTLAKMTGRSQTLKDKRIIIDQAYKEVEKELYTLDEHEYMNLMVNMLKSASQSTSKGSLIIPTDRKKIMEEAITKANVDFHIKEETNAFKGGFVIGSGKVEINLSFPYLIQKIVRPATELEVASILFT